MTAERVAELRTDDEWAAAVPILHQLWSHVDREEIRGWREDEDYRLFGMYDGDLVAVAGVSIQRVLHHARHLWVHDFVVDEAHRGAGYGRAFVEWLEAWGQQRDCEYVALAVVAGNDDAMQFYEACGMEEWGSVVETEL